MTSFSLPSEIGGGGADLVEWGLMLEEVSYLCEDLSLPYVVSLRAGVIQAIYDSGRKDLIDRYVRPMVSGIRAPVFAYTDGTDAFSFRSTVRETPEGYVLTGEKPFASGGDTADTFMTYVRSQREGSDDLQVFLVERSDPGVEVIPAQLAGLRSAGVVTLRLNDVSLSKNRLLVRADGLSHAQKFLNGRRVLLACIVLGRMQAIMNSCIASLSDTIRYERPLTAMQHVQAQIGRMYAIVETTRSMVYRALEHQADPFWDPLGSLAKLYAVDQGIALVHIAQRLLGGNAYVQGNHYERYLRDFCGFIPGGGSQDTIEVDLGIAAISTNTR